jgi:tellurite resistance protein
MWLEGLISAARAVAEATRQLVHCANEAANGRLDEAALIASSRTVASATAQLVAATRAKSDPMSKTQAKLDAAAQAITKATAMLVAAAKKRVRINVPMMHVFPLFMKILRTHHMETSTGRRGSGGDDYEDE